MKGCQREPKFILSSCALLLRLLLLPCTLSGLTNGSGVPPPWFPRTFAIDFENNTFVRDGQPFRYISGSVHYFRMVEDSWDDILKKCRLAGLNAIQTYVEWSSHQPSPALEFNFEGHLNLFKFLDKAQENDLLVILRPSPFIDAERDMGGLPPWLLWQKPNMQLRTSDLEYAYFVSRWYDYLLPKIKPYLYQNGGPIITIQVENEYGSYSCDKGYLQFLIDLIRFHLGDEVVLFTTDGSGDGYLKCGTISGAYPSVDFGTASLPSVLSNFAVQRHFAPKGPLINSEFYPGWLDHWQEPHSAVSTKAVADTLQEMLRLKANVNIYMFYGGTSFGYGAGSNGDSNSFTPCPTSYDYDAPLNEAGDPTEKYFAIKDVISQFYPVPDENPIVTSKGSYGKVYMRPFTTVLDPEFLMIFGQRAVESDQPLSFEDLKVGSGFVLYEADIDFMVTDPAILSAPNLRDRAYVYVDTTFVGILSRSEKIKSAPIFTRVGSKVQFLVENQGRPCYGHSIGESKGLGPNVTLGSHALKKWAMYKLGKMDGHTLTKYSHSIDFTKINKSIMFPQRNGFYVGNFSMPNRTILDTFVRFDGWTKGLIWINGFNLGRYWPVVGPQETLYLPASLLKTGKNTIVIFELESTPSSCTDPESFSKNCYVSLTDKHVLNGSTPLTQFTNLLQKSSNPELIIVNSINSSNALADPDPHSHPQINVTLKLKSSAGFQDKQPRVQIQSFENSIN